MVRFIEFKVTGALALNKRFSRIEKFVRMDIERLTQEQAVSGARKAASIAPVDTGMLIQAISSEVAKGKGAGWRIVSRTPSNTWSNKYRKMTNPFGVPYHVYMEEGTNRNRAHKFMARTTEWLEKEYPAKISKGISDVLKK